MLKQRIITAVILGLGLLAVLFWLPRVWGLVAFGAVVTIGAWEWAALGDLRRARMRAMYALGIAALSVLSWWWSRQHHQVAVFCAVACVWWGAACVWLVVSPQFRRPLLVLACGVLVLVPCFVAVAAVHGGAGAVHGPQAVFWLLAWVFSADIGAYFAGRAFGRLKLAPRVSPGKTWEGVFGGLALSTCVAAAGAHWFGIAMLPAMSFGVALIGISIVGDLTESMFKRGAGVKDSGTVLPGHGGILDRIDSVTAAAPLYALGLYSSGALQ
jgi:phosphatidate cytidylyltransferase